MEAKQLTATAPVEKQAVVKSEPGADALQDPLAFLSEYSAEPKASEAAPEATQVAEVEPEVSKETESDLSHTESNAVAPDAESKPGDEEPKPEDDKLTDADEDDLKKEPQWFQKRIDKEVGKRKAAEEKLAKLLAEQESSKTAPSKAESEPPEWDVVSQSPEVKKLAVEQDNALSNLRQAEALLDRMDDEPYEVLQTLIKAKLLEDAATERDAKRFLRQQERQWGEKLHESKTELKMTRSRIEEGVRAATAQNNAAAIAHYPWLKDKNSEEYEATVKAFEAFPFLRKHPLGVAAAAAIGKEHVAWMKAKAAPADEVKPKVQPPKMPGMTTAAPRGGKMTDSGATAMEKAVKSGSADDVARALESI